MSEADVELARRAIEWFAIDAPFPHDIFSEDWVWRPSVTGGDLVTGGTFIGPEGWEEYRLAAHEAWASLAIEGIALEDLGGGVVAGEHVIRGVGQASEATVKMPVYTVIVVRAGRIASVHAFRTAEEARRHADELLGGE